MDILFFSRMIPKEVEKEVRGNSKGTMQDAAIGLQRRMIEGIEKQEGVNLRIINKMILNSYPKYYKKPIINEFRFSHKDDESKQDVNLGFINICYIKQLLKSFCFKKHIRAWMKNNVDSPVLVAYTLDKEFLQMMKYVKNRNLKVKTCAIVADLPQFADLSSNRSFMKKIFVKYNSYRAKKLYKYIDSWVLLTEQMADRLQIDKPYKVIEGIATDTFKNDVVKNDSDIKSIFYAGTLHRKFGIVNLLDAFEYIKDENYRLTICGIGDSEDIIKQRANKDSRINFLSVLPREKVLKMMQEATVIVNPRQNNEEFTKYSFPSKNLEAISSGVPFIAYKLDGIPEEYSDYINYVEGDLPEDFARKIVEICEKTPEERYYIGAKACEFVKKNKNSQVQMKKMINMLNDL